MKYAIYKTPYGGLRSADYVDNLKDCQNYLFGPLIKETNLPIIVNRVGGYTSFNPDDQNFVEIIECDEDVEPLTREQRYPKNSETFEYGWIDTEGNTYSCSYEDHWESAECICRDLNVDTYNAESKLEKLNWLKVTLMYGRGTKSRRVLPSNGPYITKKQADTLIDLGLHLEDDMVEKFIEYSERRW